MYKITICKKIDGKVKIVKDFTIFEPPPLDEVLRKLVEECGGDFFDICRTDIDVYLDVKWENERRRYTRNFSDSG